MFSRIKTNAIVGDHTRAREALKPFESFQPIVAPQIAPQLAETLAKFNQHNAESAAAVFKAIGPKPFNFAKTFEGLDVRKIVSPQLSKAFESVQALGLPSAYGVEIAEALRARPSTVPREMAATAEATAEEAIALATADAVVGDVDETVVARIAAMSPKERRVVALDLIALVGACVVLAAWLAQGDLKDPRGAAIVLAWAVSLIRLYWRLTDKA